jgi:uncharacterized protein
MGTAMQIEESILAALRQIQKDEGVRVLMAVESGSRAWGFASPDSDYDVRFIYVHPLNWYLSINEQRDVIERMLPNDLDINGWELRKALRLLAKSNIALNEWIGSAVRYADTAGFREDLTQLIPLFFNPIAAIHHYRSMAETALEKNIVGQRIGIKKLFYALRPIFACAWIETHRTQPPTAFDDLLTAQLRTTIDYNWITNLKRVKSLAKESDTVGVPFDQLLLLRAMIDRYKNAPAFIEAAQPSSHSPLDATLRNWIAATQSR